MALKIIRTIPERLAAECQRTSERRFWLERLPSDIQELQDRWSLRVGAPFDKAEGSCAWVAPALCKDGTRAVLKFGMPHLEGKHEIQGLCFWNGDPTVYILEADENINAMLLERCEPGTTLRQLPEEEQDVILAGLFKRLWRAPSPPHSFSHLSVMVDHWTNETIKDARKWPDPKLVKDGLRLFEELSSPSSTDVLLATDLHAGNVLRAQREPWLVIDPKPFVGDPAYDATQHLFNCEARVQAAPNQTISRFADLLEVEHERVRLWMFARAAAEPRDVWSNDSLALARALS